MTLRGIVGRELRPLGRASLERYGADALGKGASS